MVEVLADEILNSIGKCIDASVESMKDPLEVFSASVRIFITILTSKPEWAQFIIRISATPHYKHLRIFQRLFRDIGKVAKMRHSRRRRSRHGKLCHGRRIAVFGHRIA